VQHWKRLTVVLVILALVVVACSGPGSGGRQGVNEGNQALDFTLEALDGGQVSLSDYKDNVVLINFWATWCPPCQAEIPDLEAAYRAHQDDGFIVLGIASQDHPKIVELFVEDVGMTYPVVVDESGALMKKYRAAGLPVTVIVDRDGVIQIRHIGYLSAAQLDEYLAKVLP
jgi:peroxiredoxin